MRKPKTNKKENKGIMLELFSTISKSINGYKLETVNKKSNFGACYTVNHPFQ